MLEHLLRQYRLGGFNFEGPDDKGGAGPDDPDVTEEKPEKSLSLDELTNKRVHGNDEPAEDEPSDESSLHPDDDPSDEEEPTDEPDESEEEEEIEDPGTDEPSDEEDEGEDQEDEGAEEEDSAFYDPEKFKEDNEIDRDVPHTNTFQDEESAQFAAINKASMIRDALDELEELDTDRGAIKLPTALQGDTENLDSLENLEHVANMGREDLQKFLWESDEFRHKIQDKANRIKKQQESEQVTQKFETLQSELFDGVATLLGGEENITEDVTQALESGKSKGREFLENKIDARIESELAEDVKEIEDFIDSEEAEQLSPKELTNRLDRMRDDLKSKRADLREEYSGVVETYEEAFDLAPKVQEAKPKTEAQIINNAYDTLDVWQGDRQGDSDLLTDDPGAKAELEAFVKNAMRVKDKFNNLQHPSDWNDAENWWYNEFKPSVKAQDQKDELDDDTRSSKGSDSDDDIDEPDPSEQKDIREDDAEDVYEMNKQNLDKLERMTEQA